MRLLYALFAMPVLSAAQSVAPAAYRGDFAFVNIGNASDSGKWRVEGSSVCNDWRNLRPSCSEVRLLGDVMYVKRANNGEVIAVQSK